TVCAPNSANRSRASSKPAPTMTADGSPSRRASVSSSVVTFLTAPPSWSTRTRTSAMPALSDEFLRREVLGELDAAVALVLDDRAGLLRRARREVLDGRRRPGQAHLSDP